MPTRRNPVVRAATILRKGGVHTQSRSGRRSHSKRQLEDELDDWYYREAADDDTGKTQADHASPDERQGKESGADARPFLRMPEAREKCPLPLYI